METTSEAIAAEFEQIVAEDGPWTAHAIELGHGLSTRPTHRTGVDMRLARTARSLVDVFGSLAGRRVLDLACLEGQFGLELGLRGAEVLAVDAREDNLRKAAFAAKTLGVVGYETLQSDVRALDVETHGRFDIITNCGLLYHLDAESALELLASMQQMCSGVMVLETCVSLSPVEDIEWRGHSYDGLTYRERAAADVIPDQWTSVGNDDSFWFTKGALVNALCDVGFSTVTEVLAPAGGVPADRVTLLAFNGEPDTLRTRPDRAIEHRRIDTKAPPRRHPSQLRAYRALLSLRPYWSQLPPQAQTRLKKLLRLV